MKDDENDELTLESFRSVPLFASLNDEEAASLRDLLEMKKATAGAVLFRAGQPGDSLYLINEGRVRIHLRDSTGDDVTLAELGRGDFFGEMALLDGETRSADATVTEDAHLSVLRRDDFLGFVRVNPDVALHMLAAVSERLRRTDELLRQRVSRNVNEIDEERKTFADRMADAVSSFGGSWTFIFATTLFVFLWMTFNSYVMRDQGVDPFPYSFLDVINGIVAALLAPIILISQNRQNDKDRLRSDLDFKINLKNELALAELSRRLDVLESERLPHLFDEQHERLKSVVSSGR